MRVEMRVGDGARLGVADEGRGWGAKAKVGVEMGRSPIGSTEKSPIGGGCWSTTRALHTA